MAVLQPVYSVSELGALLGMSRQKTHRYLKARAIPVDRASPGKYLVWLADLQLACPSMRGSVTLARARQLALPL